MSEEATGAGGAEWRPSFNPWLIAMAVMAAVFMEVLDTTITSVALPNMAGSMASTRESLLRTRARKRESMISTAVGPRARIPGTASPDANTEGK